ncbi:MAG TPA: efflux RND transporter periplasmic adaptor subunit [Thermoguttaceae bacterium]|nr:efflux RND transporter periplasmic adaptor subunit [Thermoguttaceae bacterium]
MKIDIKAVRARLKGLLPLGSAFVFLAGLVLVIAWMAGVFEEKIQAGQVDVQRERATDEEIQNAYVVEEKTKDYIEVAVGSLKAADRTEISSRVLAPIQSISVTAGSRVNEGDTLVMLDRRALDAERSKAVADLIGAEAAVKRADGDYRRAADLFGQKMMSQANYEEAVEALKVASAKWQYAKEALVLTDVRLSYTEIKAPKTGVVIDRYAEPGDMAQPGGRLLALYDPRSLRLEVPVMENLVKYLKLGQTLDAYIDARERWVKTTVGEIVPQAEAGSRSFLVKVVVPPSDDLFEGMFGRLQIPAGQRKHLCLHTGTIETIGQLKFVEVIGQSGFKSRRLVKTGREGDPNHVEVLSGVKQGDRVVMKCTDAERCPTPSP